jgi:hypothetical protein
MSYELAVGNRQLKRRTTPLLPRPPFEIGSGRPTVCFRSRWAGSTPFGNRLPIQNT